MSPEKPDYYSAYQEQIDQLIRQFNELQTKGKKIAEEILNPELGKDNENYDSKLDEFIVIAKEALRLKEQIEELQQKEYDSYGKLIKSPKKPKH